jgi:hypothetical protein
MAKASARLKKPPAPFHHQRSRGEALRVKTSLSECLLENRSVFRAEWLRREVLAAKVGRALKASLWNRRMDQPWPIKGIGPLAVGLLIGGMWPRS